MSTTTSTSIVVQGIITNSIEPISMPIITLTTDFGHSDPFVGVMKGVILGIAPEAQIVDLCHEIPPQDILAGALSLDASVDFFPPGAVHVAVVDPGVGSSRPAIAVECERFFLVGPDNGLFTCIINRHPIRNAVSLTNEEFHHKPVSATFHGRDVFAPVGAHLASGVALERIGEPIANLVELELPPLVETGEMLETEIVHVDGFGNLVTNLSWSVYIMWRGELSDNEIYVQIGPRTRLEIRRTYSDVPPGVAVAYFGSIGRLELAVREDSAAKLLGLSRGSKIVLHK